jgi:hypothetical protein
MVRWPMSVQRYGKPPDDRNSKIQFEIRVFHWDLQANVISQFSPIVE